MNSFGYDLCIEHDNFLLHILHFAWSNDSIVSKSVEGLASVFEIFILHDRHWDSISVFPLNEAMKQFRQNLCSHFKIFIGFFCLCFCLWSAFAFYLWAKFSGSKYPFLEKSNSLANVAILNTVFSPSSCCYCLFLLIAADITEQYFSQILSGCKEGLLFFVLIRNTCSIFTWCFSLQ